MKEHHTMYILFVLGLFVVFGMCALAVIHLGIKIYGDSEAQLEENNNSHTAMTYCLTKIRENNNKNQITVHNNRLEIKDGEATTYIYQDGQHLKEAYTNQPFDQSLGETLMPIDHLSLSLDDHLLTISITTNKHQETSTIMLQGE